MQRVESVQRVQCGRIRITNMEIRTSFYKQFGAIFCTKLFQKGFRDSYSEYNFLNRGTGVTGTKKRGMARYSEKGQLAKPN